MPIYEISFNSSEYMLILEIMSKMALEKTITKREDCYIIEFYSEELEKISDAVQDILQFEGFTYNYSPTTKGLILEGLIDKFHKKGF